MQIGRKIFLLSALMLLMLFPGFAQAFNLPKAKLARVDKPAVLSPLEFYKVSYQNDLKVLSKLSLGDEKFSQETILDLIKDNNVKLSCDKKILLKISNDKCTELKVATFFLNKQLQQGFEGDELKNKTDIKFPLGVLNGNFYYYSGFEELTVFVLSGKNEFYIYFGLDVASSRLFEVISDTSGKNLNRILVLAVDKDRVYLIDGVKISVINGVSTNLTKISNPDSPTYDIVSFSHPFSDNGNFYYFFNDKLFYFKSSLSSYFDTVFMSVFKDDNKVFVQGKKGEVWEMVGADVKSFNSFSHYGADGSIFDYFDIGNIYFEGHDGLYKIDLSKYKLIGKDSYSSIIKDKKEVMYFNKKNRKFYIIPGADAKTFEAAPDYQGVFFVDSKYVYLRNGDLSVKRLVEIDRASFSLAYDAEFYDNSVLLFKDKKGRYTVVEEPNDKYVIKKLPPVNGSEIIYHSYGVALSKDSKNVYVSSRGQRDVLSGADPESFVIVQDNQTVYAKDNNFVYVPTGCQNYKVKKIVGADPNTFKAVGLYGFNYFGLDKNSVWRYDKKTCLPIKIKGAKPDNFNFDDYLNK